MRREVRSSRRAPVLASAPGPRSRVGAGGRTRISEHHVGVTSHRHGHGPRQLPSGNHFLLGVWQPPLPTAPCPLPTPNVLRAAPASLSPRYPTPPDPAPPSRI